MGNDDDKHLIVPLHVKDGGAIDARIKPASRGWDKLISGYLHLCIFSRYFVALFKTELFLDPRIDLANGQLQHHASVFPFEWELAVDAGWESSCYQPVRLAHNCSLISFYA
jgi:hypothetical protein